MSKLAFNGAVAVAVCSAGVVLFARKLSVSYGRPVMWVLLPRPESLFESTWTGFQNVRERPWGTFPPQGPLWSWLDGTQVTMVGPVAQVSARDYVVPYFACRRMKNSSLRIMLAGVPS